MSDEVWNPLQARLALMEHEASERDRITKLNAQERLERWHCIIDHTVELMGAPDYALITPVLLERLAGYRDHGYPVGDFLQAVIANDLKDAIGRADEYNRSSLYHLVAWMYNEFPAPLWGSREKYSAWIEQKAKEREEAAVTESTDPGAAL